MKRIAITGGIAEGKSTVLGYCADAGRTVLSSDDVARLVFEEQAVQERLAALLDVPVPVDRAALRSRLAAAPELRRSVNAVMHEPIARTIIEAKADVVEVPLLIETALHPHFERVWVVTCGHDLQVSRLASRLGSEKEALGLMNAQLPTRSKLAFADLIIRTNFDQETVKRNVIEALEIEFGERG
jgi:dephospho-CoA kinase